MVTLQNEYLEIRINDLGAELISIYNKTCQIDYLWNGDTKYWGKHAPILFPIVGALKNNDYYYKGKCYTLPRHGFARERKFTLIHSDNLSARFKLIANAETFSCYPFNFSLVIHYKLQLDRLSIIYEVENMGKEEMYFSIGGHPAFNVPLEKHLSYTDYYLEFNQVETIDRWPLKHNLVDTASRSLLRNEFTINLQHQLFASDAVIMKHFKSTRVSLRSNASKHGLSVRIDEFPFLGIWAAPNAPFVCIEPWQGLADSIDSSQKIEEKEGIITLPSTGHWAKSWDISFF